MAQAILAQHCYSALYRFRGWFKCELSNSPWSPIRLMSHSMSSPGFQPSPTYFPTVSLLGIDHQLTTLGRTGAPPLFRSGNPKFIQHVGGFEGGAEAAANVDMYRHVKIPWRPFSARQVNSQPRPLTLSYLSYNNPSTYCSNR